MIWDGGSSMVMNTFFLISNCAASLFRIALAGLITGITGTGLGLNSLFPSTLSKPPNTLLEFTMES